MPHFRSGKWCRQHTRCVSGRVRKGICDPAHPDACHHAATTAVDLADDDAASDSSKIAAMPASSKWLSAAASKPAEPSTPVAGRVGSLRAALGFGSAAAASPGCGFPRCLDPCHPLTLRPCQATSCLPYQCTAPTMVCGVHHAVKMRVQDATPAEHHISLREYF